MFDFKNEEVEELYFEFLWSLDGTQPCAVDPDEYVENYTSRPIPIATAEGLCQGRGCKFVETCKAYAVAAQEEAGIWGGTTPEQRKGLYESG